MISRNSGLVVCSFSIVDDVKSSSSEGTVAHLKNLVVCLLLKKRILECPHPEGHYNIYIYI